MQTECISIIREFNCRKCGKLVKVRNQKDFRTRFCGHECEKAYWKHPHKERPVDPVFRFHCKECGILVIVSDPKDRRTCFCSADCRIKWNRAYLKNAKRCKVENNND